MNIQRPLSKQPLPTDAKCVFRGIMFDVYQWEVQGYDGKKKTFEKIKRPDTVAVIAVTTDAKILIIREEQPGKGSFMSYIGGRVDEGEDILEAAKRELLEESGYEAETWVLLDAVQPVSKMEWAVYTFVAKGCKKVTTQNLDGAEKIDIQLIDFDTFVEMAAQDQLNDLGLAKRFLEAKLDHKKMDEIKNILFSD